MKYHHSVAQVYHTQHYFQSLGSELLFDPHNSKMKSYYPPVQTKHQSHLHYFFQRILNYCFVRSYQAIVVYWLFSFVLQSPLNNYHVLGMNLHPVKTLFGDSFLILNFLNSFFELLKLLRSFTSSFWFKLTDPKGSRPSTYECTR